MSGLDKVLNVFGLQVEYEDDEQVGTETSSAKEEKQTRASRKHESRNVNQPDLKIGTTAAQVILLEPDKINDAEKICNELKDGKTIVINVEKLRKEDIVRLYDFVSGATYALEGKMKEISDNVLVIAPSNVDIQTSEVVSTSTYDYDYDDEDDEFEF